MSVYAEYEPYESFFKNKNTPIYSIKSYAWNANTFKINPNHMYKTIELAKKNNVKVGAHPSLPDLQGFGRRAMKLQSIRFQGIP